MFYDYICCHPPVGNRHACSLRGAGTTVKLFLTSPVSCENAVIMTVLNNTVPSRPPYIPHPLGTQKLLPVKRGILVKDKRDVIGRDRFIKAEID
jgi:hypothetical protein